jgi:hypothetical protein
LRDTTNLEGALKPLEDALKNVGLITDDSTRWLERIPPRQEVDTRLKWAETMVRLYDVEQNVE